MRYSQSIVALTALVLTACGPVDLTRDIEALPSGAVAEERVIEAGLSVSLAPAEGFGNPGPLAGKVERSQPR